MSSGNFGARNTKSAKLTWTSVRSIRERYAEGWTQGQLAREFGVGVVQIGRIVRHECWWEGSAAGPRTTALQVGEVPVPTMMLEGLLKEQEIRKEVEGDVPPKISGVEMSLQAVKERAGGFGRIIDFEEPGRDMAPGDYSDPTGRRGS